MPRMQRPVQVARVLALSPDCPGRRAQRASTDVRVLFLGKNVLASGAITTPLANLS